MKQIISLALMICLFSTMGFCQGVLKINGYANYATSGKFDSYYDVNDNYDGKIEGGFQKGLGLEYSWHRNYSLELSWLQQNTKAPVNYIGENFSTIKFTNFNLCSNFFMIGGNRYFNSRNSKIEPYAGIAGGLTMMRLGNPDDNTTTRKEFLAWSVKGGANVYITNSLGLKLNAQLVSSVQSVGGEFYFGPGGNNVGLATYSSLIQLCVGAGLVVKLSGK